MRYVYLYSLILLVAASAQAAESIEVAEYRADVDDVNWQVGGEAANTHFGDGVTQPWGLSELEAASTLEKGVRIGPYQLSGGVDLYHRQNFSGAQLYDTEYALSLGPRFAFSANSFTDLFYSLEQAEVAEERQSDRWGGDSLTQRAGLTQTWFLARRKAKISLGYGFEQGDTQDLYDDLRGHSLVFSSRFPLFWGLSARIKADYAQNTYLDYLGAGEVGSDRQVFRAAIDRSFSERLYGEFQFSYLNEEFDDSDLSYRRYVWGLNLRYRY